MYYDVMSIFKPPFIDQAVSHLLEFIVLNWLETKMLYHLNLKFEVEIE